MIMVLVETTGIVIKGYWVLKQKPSYKSLTSSIKGRTHILILFFPPRKMTQLTF